MASEREDGPGPGAADARAEAAFASWLAGIDRGEAADFDTFCEERPGIGDSLRRMHAAWLAGRAPRPHESRIQSIREFLDRKIHPAERAPVDLDPEAAEEPSSGIQDRLAELSTRSDRYEPRAEVARGGMGVILKVWDRDLRRTLAMKASFQTVDREAAPGEELRSHDLNLVSRFLEEAQITGQLDHPGIVPVHELGVDPDGRLFFTMRLVRGRQLDEIFRLARADKDGWNTVRALGVVVRVCEALAFAHSKGVIHRDIKPANIMVGKFGEVYVMDWGLAKVLGRDEPVGPARHSDASILRSRVDTDRAQDLRRAPSSELLTMEGTIIGTPPYMPPEQAEGRLEDLDPRADIYSVGALLYTLLTGRMPYVARGELVTAGDVIRRLAEGPPDAVADLDSSVPPELIAVCEKAMARDPDDRYARMSDLGEDLHAYIERRVVRAYETGAVAEFKKWVQRNRGIAAAIAALLVLAIGGTAAIAVQQRQRVREVSTAQRLTEEARARAEQSRNEAVANAEAARANAARAERQGYLARIAAAQASLRMNETREARQLLAACPPELRGWEWGHLVASTDTSLQVLTGHEAKVTAVAFSPDGARVVSGSADKSVRLWTSDDGAALFALPGAPDAVTALAWSPDGTRIAGASQDLLVRIWDAQAGRLVGTLPGLDAVVGALAFSPDGGRLAAAMEERVGVWDLASLRTVAVLAHDDPVHALAFLDATRLATGGEGGVRLWDLATGAPAWTIPAAEPVLCLAAEGERLAAGMLGEGALVLDAADGSVRGRLEGHDDPVSAVAFEPGGARVVTASLDRTVRVWDPAGGAAVAVLRGHDEAVLSVDVAAGGHIVSGSADGTLRLWRADAGSPVLTLRGDEDFLSAIVFDARGRTVAASSAGHGEIRVWDAASGEQVRYIPEEGGGLSSLALSDDGTLLAAGGEEDATVRLFATTTGEPCGVLTGHIASVSNVAFSPGGDRLATGSADTTVRLWDVADGTCLRVIDGHDRRVSGVAFSPGGDRLLTCSFDRTVRVWDPASGASLLELPAQPGPVLVARYTPDGTAIVTGCSDGVIRVFDAASGAPVRELAGHTGAVTALVFFPDGSRLVSGGHDKTIRLWDPATGDPLLRFQAHDGWVTGLSVSPAGDRIASCSYDTTARIWSR